MTKKQILALSNRLQRLAFDLDWSANRLLDGGHDGKGYRLLTLARDLGKLGRDLGTDEEVSRMVFREAIRQEAREREGV